MANRNRSQIDGNISIGFGSVFIALGGVVSYLGYREKIKRSFILNTPLTPLGELEQRIEAAPLKGDSKETEPFFVKTSKYPLALITLVAGELFPGQFSN
jgi:hypothetical protein